MHPSSKACTCRMHSAASHPEQTSDVQVPFPPAGRVQDSPSLIATQPTSGSVHWPQGPQLAGHCIQGRQAGIGRHQQGLKLGNSQSWSQSWGYKAEARAQVS